jgi:hypothetical protein
MLAVRGGRLILMSTPFGKRGHFWREWSEGVTWTRVEVPASRVPRISKEFLEEERRAMGDWWYSQEYLCEFRESTDSVFSHESIVRAVRSDVLPLWED